MPDRQPLIHAPDSHFFSPLNVEQSRGKCEVLVHSITALSHVSRIKTQNLGNSNADIADTRFAEVRS